MTAVQGNAGTETAVTEDEKISSGKKGTKNKSWGKIKNVVNTKRNFKQKNDSSKISKNNPKEDEENFDDTKTVNSKETADTNASNVSQKTQSKWKLWFSRKSKEKAKNNPAEKANETEKDDEKTVSGKDDSDDLTVSKNEKESEKSTASKKRKESEKSAASKKKKEAEKEYEKIVSEEDSSDDSTISKSKKHRRSAETKSRAKKKRKKAKNIKFKIDLAGVSRNYTDALETDSESADEEFEDESEVGKFDDSDSEGGSEDFSAESDQNRTERKSSISSRKNSVNSSNKRNKLSSSSKIKLSDENQTRKKRKDIKFNINLSKFMLDDEEGDSSDTMMPATNTQLLQDQNAFGQPNQMTNLQPTLIQQPDQFANQNLAIQPNQMTNLQPALMQQPDQFANQNLNDMSGQAMGIGFPQNQNPMETNDFPQDDEEDDINGGMNQINMLQTPSATVAPMMQPLDTTAPTNTMIVSNAMPAPMYAMPAPMYPSMAGMNNQLSVQSENGNSQPSFLESFLQNLNGQNSNEQNQMFQQPNGFPNEGQSHMHPYSDSDPARNRYNVEINQLNHRVSSLEQYLMNNNGQSFSGSMSNADTIKGSRNLSDDEVAEEVIQYLRELDVLDESKFSQLSMRDIGLCIICRNRKEVIILDREKNMGICKSCARDLINDSMNGRSLGSRSMLNRGRYRRDSGIDLSDDLSRDRFDRYGRARERDSGSGLEKELFGGSNGGVVGSLISAGVTQALMKKSSDQQQTQQTWNSNPNFRMGANAFMSPQGMPMSGMMPQNGQSQGVGANGAVSEALGEQMLLNAAGQLVPLNSLAGTGAPYGYKKDSATGTLTPASSLEEGLAAAQLVAAQIVMSQQTSAGANVGGFSSRAVAGQQSPTGVVAGAGGTAVGGTAEQMVLNAAGQLVPLSSLAGTGAPYGYKIDPATGTLIPALSPEEGLSAAQPFTAQSATAQQSPTGVAAGAGGTAVGGIAVGGTGFGGSTEQMVLNAAGQLVPLSSLAGTGAPYGYVIDPQTGMLIPAQTLEEGLAVAQQYSAATSAGSTTGETSVGEAAGGTMSGQMVLNAAGLLVPISALAGSAVPYGYKIDSATSTLIPASSIEEGLATAQQISAQSNQQTSVPMNSMDGGMYLEQQQWNSDINNSAYGTNFDQTQQQDNTETKSGGLLSSIANAASGMGKYGKVAAGVAAGAAVLGAGVAAVKALKKNKSSNGTDGAASGTDGNTAKSGGSKLKTAAKVAAGVAIGAAALGGTYLAYKAIKKSKDAKNSSGTGSDGANGPSASSQSDVSLGQYSAEEVRQAKKTSDELTKKISKANKNVEKAKKEVQDAEKKVKKKEEKLSSAKNKDKAQNELNSAKEALERAQRTLQERQETLNDLQQQQAALKEKSEKEGRKTFIRQKQG